MFVLRDEDIFVAISSISGSSSPSDAPFITSLVKKKAVPPQQTSSALQSFMKFDRKYGVKGSTLAAAAAKTDSEPDPEISEEATVSPSKIASELEEKVR